MELKGWFQTDIPGGGEVKPYAGGTGQGNDPLKPGHLRVSGYFQGGELAFAGPNPAEGWEGWLAPAMPDAETAARAEEARQLGIKAALARDELLRREGPLPVGGKVYLAKGCAWAAVPEGAIAYLGGHERETLVWLGLDPEGQWRPLVGVTARSAGPATWLDALSDREVSRIFEEASLLDVRRGGRTAAETVFGTRG